MTPGPPITELPGEVTFTLDEAATLLFVADIAVEHTTQGSTEHSMADEPNR